jgi:hypothetical protein
MTVVFAAPALPLHTAGPYVFAAYIVFVAMILIYVAIMAVRLGRSQRDIENLAALMRERGLEVGESGQVLEENRPGGDSPGMPNPDREAESVL